MKFFQLSLAMALFSLLSPLLSYAKPLTDLPKPILNKPSAEQLELIAEKKAKAQFDVIKPNDTKPNFTAGLDAHRTLLEKRLQRLNLFERIPEDKKTMLEEGFQAEIDWLQEARGRLQTAITTEERLTMRAEIREHLKAAQVERRGELAKTIHLPEESPVEPASAISSHFTTMLATLETAGVDVTASQQLLDNYQADVTNLEAAHVAVGADKTIETIQNLKLALEQVRSSSLVLRNQLRSILMLQIKPTN